MFLTYLRGKIESRYPLNLTDRPILVTEKHAKMLTWRMKNPQRLTWGGGTGVWAHSHYETYSFYTPNMVIKPNVRHMGIGIMWPSTHQCTIRGKLVMTQFVSEWTTTRNNPSCKPSYIPPSHYPCNHHCWPVIKFLTRFSSWYLITYQLIIDFFIKFNNQFNW